MAGTLSPAPPPSTHVLRGLTPRRSRGRWIRVGIREWLMMRAMSDDGGTGPGTAATTVDAEALERSTAVRLPLVLSAILPLVLSPGSTRSVLAAIVNVMAWGVHGRLRRARTTPAAVLEYLARSLRPQRGGAHRAVVPVVRSRRGEVRAGGPPRRVARLVMATKGPRRLFERLGRVAMVAALVVVCGAAVAYGAEHSTNPGFKTYGDASGGGSSP